MSEHYSLLFAYLWRLKTFLRTCFGMMTTSYSQERKYDQK